SIVTTKNFPSFLMSASTEDRARWGTALADQLTSMPNIRDFLSTGGVDLDCSHLIATAKADQALSAQVQAMTSTIEAGIHHAKTTLESSIETLESSLDIEKMETASLREANAELQRLVNQLSASLSGATTGGGGGAVARRITSDPDKFAGTEKDIAKRQREYVNWRSQVK